MAAETRSSQRGANVERLCRLIHEEFGVHSVVTGWTSSDIPYPLWEETPPEYAEAIRRTVEELLRSEWTQELVRAAQATILDELVAGMETSHWGRLPGTWGKAIQYVDGWRELI